MLGHKPKCVALWYWDVHNEASLRNGFHVELRCLELRKLESRSCRVGLHCDLWEKGSSEDHLLGLSISSSVPLVHWAPLRVCRQVFPYFKSTSHIWLESVLMTLFYQSLGQWCYLQNTVVLWGPEVRNSMWAFREKLRCVFPRPRGSKSCSL